MKIIVRTVLAIIGGCVVGFGALMAVKAIRHMFYPVPHDLNFSELAVIQAHVLNYPLGAFLFVIAGWIFATFSGGISAALLAPKRERLVATIIGAIVLIVTLVNIIIIPHPFWVSLAGLFGVIVAALLVPQFVTPFRTGGHATFTNL